MSSLKGTCVIRKAEPKDCEGIITLIQELVAYQKMPASNIDAETLRKDGFGAEKMLHCFVAEDIKSNKLVGHALYFFNYCTSEGVYVYLEDLYVKAEYRQAGIGTRLWKAVAEVAVEKGCKQMDWVCLDWNKATCEYYEAKGARNITKQERWNLFRLDSKALKDLSDE